MITWYECFFFHIRYESSIYVSKKCQVYRAIFFYFNFKLIHIVRLEKKFPVVAMTHRLIVQAL